MKMVAADDDEEIIGHAAAGEAPHCERKPCCKTDQQRVNARMQRITAPLRRGLIEIVLIRPVGSPSWRLSSMGQLTMNAAKDAGVPCAAMTPQPCATSVMRHYAIGGGRERLGAPAARHLSTSRTRRGLIADAAALATLSARAVG